MSNVSAFTARQRMLAAYTGAYSDVVPVAPEFWYYIPARLLGMPMYEFEQDVPHWQALQQTFKHYRCEGWGIVTPEAPAKWGGTRTIYTRRRSPDRLEVHTVLKLGGRRIVSRSVMDAREPSWVIERPIKDFAADWPIYERMTLVPPEELDWRPVQAALDAVGEDYLLEVYVGLPFVDFAGNPRAGGLEQVILDLVDHESELLALQERYIENMVGKIRAAFAHTTARSIFIGSTWSTLSLLSPKVWRKWEKPVLEAAACATHACGGLFHHHFHGRCMAVLEELASVGCDCICPFERPPGGDVTDLPRVRQMLDERTAFNGNIHTVETLIRGTPSDVRREVLEILEAWGNSPRLIVGTGDQVGVETPDENIWAMIETVREHGSRQPLV
jgi:hypothetical protein